MTTLLKCDRCGIVGAPDTFVRVNIDRSLGAVSGNINSQPLPRWQFDIGPECRPLLRDFFTGVPQ